MRNLIQALGGTTAVAKALDLKVSQVNNWNVRGVPWRYRLAVANLAKAKDIQLPPDFLPEIAA